MTDYFKILMNYRQFLLENGVTYDSPEKEAKRQIETVDLPTHIYEAVVGNELGTLGNRDVVELYRRMGVQNYIDDLRPDVKIRQLEALLSSIPDVIGIDSAIEFGSGVGLSAIFLAKELGWRMAGVDACNDFIEFSKLTAEQQGVNIEWHCKYAHDTRLPDNYCDLAYAIDLIDCSRAWPLIVHEMTRMARKVVLIYSLTSKYRKIDPWDVVYKLRNQSMVINTNMPFEALLGCGEHYVVISAHRW